MVSQGARQSTRRPSLTLTSAKADEADMRDDDALSRFRTCGARRHVSCNGLPDGTNLVDVRT